MARIKTQALILRLVEFGESDLILHLLVPGLGRLPVIAKGARRSVKRFSGTLDLPLGARDGSTSVFVADNSGKAAFEHSFKPCLQMSDVWTTSMLAINYHSDGRTYAALPGDFGYNAHIPLFLMLPPRDGI